MFAWSRKSNQIIIDKKVEKLILDKASELANHYSSSIPLVEPADIRNKIARLAVSLACRLFSVDDNDNVVVKEAHVKYIIGFMDHIYDKPRFGYKGYSLNEFRKLNLINPREVGEILNLEDIENLEDLVGLAVVGKNLLHDLIGCNFMQGELRPKLRSLRRFNAIDEHASYYVLQPGMIDFVKDLKKHCDSGGNFPSFFIKSRDGLFDNMD